MLGPKRTSCRPADHRILLLLTGVTPFLSENHVILIYPLADVPTAPCNQRWALAATTLHPLPYFPFPHPLVTTILPSVPLILAILDPTEN